MVTKVGLQGHFSDAIKELLELEYDALEAYDVAIRKLKNTTFKEKLSEFAGDHKRHIQEISKVLDSHDEEIPNSPDAKQWLTKGKVAMASMIGDETILSAMHSNEIDTNTAYERIVSHNGMWEDARGIIERGLEDEKKHKNWLENH